MSAESQTGSERDRALRAEAQARTEADNATRSAAESEAVRKFLEDDLLAAARPEGQDGGLGRDATIRQAVNRVRPKIAGAFKDQPAIEAAVRNTLGTTYLYLGDYARGDPRARAGRGTPEGPARPRPPRHARKPQRPRRRLSDAGRTAEAIPCTRRRSS